MQAFNYFKRNLPFWHNLTAKERKIVEENSVYKEFKKGDLIYRGGSDCLGLLLIERGSLNVYMLSKEGKEIILFGLKQSNICVVSSSCLIQQITFDVFIEAEEDCGVYILNVLGFEQISKTNIMVENFSYKMLANRFSQVMLRMHEIMFNPLEKRLANILLDEIEKKQTLQLQVTHEELARYVGSVREVVSRVLKKFEKEDIIKLSRKEITIQNIEDLKVIKNK